MNLIIIICTIIEIFKIKAIFRGVSNAECSILYSINEGIEGEIKSTVPKWGGINEIKNVLNQTYYQLGKLSNNSTYHEKMKNYNKSRINFINVLIQASNNIQKEEMYKKLYFSKNYTLAIAKEFGRYNYDRYS